MNKRGLPDYSLRSGWHSVVVLLCLVASTATAADAPRLAGLVPADAGLCIELTDLVPDGGLVRGSVTVVEGDGATSLALALVAGPSAAGSWTAVVGAPDTT